LLALSRLDRPSIQEAVAAVDGLEAPPGEEGTDRPGGRERFIDADLSSELGRRQVDELTGARPSGHGGKERVRALKAFLVHARIVRYPAATRQLDSLEALRRRAPPDGSGTGKE
jgi:hypothetical protein